MPPVIARAAAHCFLTPVAVAAKGGSIVNRKSSIVNRKSSYFFPLAPLPALLALLCLGFLTFLRLFWPFAIRLSFIGLCVMPALQPFTSVRGSPAVPRIPSILFGTQILS